MCGESGPLESHVFGQQNHVREVNTAEARRRVPRIHHRQGKAALGGGDGREQEGQPRPEEREVEKGSAGVVRRVVAAAAAVELLEDFGLPEERLRMCALN